MVIAFGSYTASGRASFFSSFTAVSLFTRFADLTYEGLVIELYRAEIRRTYSRVSVYGGMELPYFITAPSPAL